MKHALLKTKSRLIMSLMIVIMSVVYTSCDDTELPILLNSQYSTQV